MRVSCTANPPITLSPAAGALPAGQEGVNYSQTVSASGGAGGYSYAVTNGSLPAGVSLNASTGELTGTPTTAGTANFTITATDTDNVFGSAAYSLQINAPASTDATLANLALSQGTLTPGFSSGTTSYTAFVGNAVTSLTVTPTVADANAAVTVNGVAVTSGISSSAISLNVGSNIITVVVTAEDGTTTQTYTVDVTRAASAVATLSNLVLSQGTLTPAFSSGTTSYTASVGNAVTSLTVTPTVTDANATV
ncbi:MAG: cadherin-like beta sandwich domain-containing protein, partial [Pannonibacter phragmitetus]